MTHTIAGKYYLTSRKALLHAFTYALVITNCVMSGKHEVRLLVRTWSSEEQQDCSYPLSAQQSPPLATVEWYDMFSWLLIKLLLHEIKRDLSYSIISPFSFPSWNRIEPHLTCIFLFLHMGGGSPCNLSGGPCGPGLGEGQSCGNHMTTYVIHVVLM